jgi:membrane fusion protein, multidrug efflux system
MAKRMIVMLALVTLVVAALATVKVRQFRAMAAQFAAMQPPPDAVTTAVAEQEEWPTTFDAIGTVAAVQGVVVSADLPGIVERIAFESGKPVHEGDLLVQLDTKQEQAQLAAAEAQLELARVNFNRMQGLVEQDAVARAEFDTAAAAHKQGDARVREIRATIDRKTIRAPFSGVLGIRQVNLGQYLNGGDPVVPLQQLDPIYVNFGVPQQDAGQMRIGRKVRVQPTEQESGRLAGHVTALDSVVDQTTRNVRVQATLANRRGALQPGMFVRAQIALGPSRSVIVVPGSSISYAPYGDSVFIVADLKDDKGASYRGVRQQVVKLGGARGDQVAIVSGIEAGAEVVTSGVFKLRNGAAVSVDNSVQPANSRAPKPEDS